MSPSTTDPDDARPDVEVEESRIEQLVQAHVAKLAEHCDSVRIIITTNRGDGNFGCYSYGNGNYYAQRDSVREWLMRQDQMTKNDASE